MSKGVTYHKNKGKWQAHIYHLGKYLYLGQWRERHLALIVRKLAALVYRLPPITTLSYSAGVQSHLLLELLLRGKLPRPQNLVVLNADPGMEDERTYAFVNTSRERCRRAGIPFYECSGPNLYTDLLNSKNLGRTRLDHPPLWTKNVLTGKIGRLPQLCTGHYKIAPMHRALRHYLHKRFGIQRDSRRLPPVTTWIGFAADETKRIKPARDRFVTFRYPLVELGWDKHACERYYAENGIEMPPRSVCVACYSNGLAYFADMHRERPDDWAKAVAVDEAVRDLRHIGINDPCYVSATCIPLRELPALNFQQDTPEYRQHRCNSGYCFV